MDELISKKNICLNLDAKNRQEVLEYIAQLAQDLGIASNKEGVLKSLIKREEEQSTNLGEYICLPHTKSEHIKKPQLFIIKLRDMISWDNSQVKLAISILAPEDYDASNHLSLIANLTRKLVNKDFRKNLIDSESKQQVLELIDSAINKGE